MPVRRMSVPCLVVGVFSVAATAQTGQYATTQGNYTPCNVAQYYHDVGWVNPANILGPPDNSQVALGNRECDDPWAASIVIGFAVDVINGPGPDVAMWRGWYTAPPGATEEGMEPFNVWVSACGSSWHLAGSIPAESSYPGNPPRMTAFELPAAVPRARFVRFQATVTHDLEINSVEALHWRCRADFNNSGSATVQDFFDFLTAYFGGEFTADVNCSVSVTVQDLFDFLAEYFTGCP